MSHLIHSYTGEELVRLQPFPAPTWLLDGLIPGGGWTLLLGAGKVGKSLFGVQLAHALATGQAFFGAANMVNRPLRVVYVQGDTPGAVWVAQLTKLQLAQPDPVQHVFPPWGILQTGITAMAAALHPYHAEYIVWDSMEKLFFGLNLNDKEVVGECLSRLGRLSGPAFLLIHHTRKSRPGEEDTARDAAWGTSFLSHDWTQQIYLHSGQGPIELSGRLISDTTLRAGKDVTRLATGAWVRLHRSYTLEHNLPSEK